LYYYPKRFFRNLIDYRKFLWYNTWFDFTFIFEILKLKLETDVKYYKKDSFSGVSEEIIEEMQICIKSLDRLIEDVYYDEAFEEHDAKWGKLEHEFLENRVKFKRKNVLNETDEEQERKEFLEKCEDETSLRKIDLEIVFDTMKNNILKWWD
jgi:hypothetical protein